MKVKQVMTKKVLTIPAGTTIRDAARVLVEKGISGAPVVDAHGTVIGIVSEKDLFRALYPSEAEFVSAPETWTDEQALLDRAREATSMVVDRLMVRDVVAVTPETKLIRAGATMLARGINRVLVMDAGKLKGIVSRRDVYQSIFKKELKL